MRDRSNRVVPAYRVLTAFRRSVRPAMLIHRAIRLLPEPAFAGSKPLEAMRYVTCNVVTV